MKIIQLLTTIAYGDAVSNDTLALKKVLEDQRYETAVYAENIDPRLKETVSHYQEMPKFSKEDIILYHLSTGTKLNYMLGQLSGRKVLIYHNITPDHFFRGYSRDAVNLGKEGEKGLRFLADKADYALADSSYNMQMLKEAGYQCPMRVLPVIIPFRDYEKKPSDRVMQKYQNDGYTNILFTGRIAPNKKQEDIIRAFYYYHKYRNPKSRLFLVGSAGGMEKYQELLEGYVQELGAENVIFTGHIPFDEILAYYHLADVFVCMSEHEGFCVPLVEAMYFDVPIIAYDSSAIAYTLGGSGLLIQDKEPAQTGELIHRAATDQKLRQTVLAGQRERLADFAYEKIAAEFKEFIKEFAGERE